MAAPDENYPRRLKILCVLEICLGIWIVVGALQQNGSLNMFFCSILATVLIITATTGFTTSEEWKKNLLTQDRLRTFASLNTATGIVGVVIAGISTLLTVLVAAGGCYSQCAERIGAPTDMQSAFSTFLRTPVLFNGPMAGLIGATGLMAGRRWRQMTVDMFSKPCQCSGTGTGWTDPCPAYEEKTVMVV